mmetsp:Transcript_16597/g.34031  ORF Transcript_16597/g.34031 Transcript_16597/m.34031 type:complete len:165 (-) Transcript_16597:424-918(-)
MWCTLPDPAFAAGLDLVQRSTSARRTPHRWCRCATSPSVDGIAQLPLQVIQQIASGEVSEGTGLPDTGNMDIRPHTVLIPSTRPPHQVIASWRCVVRELVENAIDAHPSRIVIEISPLHHRVVVSDNGHGMTRSNLLRSYRCNYTSKIRNLRDLRHQCSTLGSS